MTAVDWEGRGLKASDLPVQDRLPFAASQLLGCGRHSRAGQKGISDSSVALSVETCRTTGKRGCLVEDPEIHAGATFSSLVSTMRVCTGAKFMPPGLGHL